jgi:4a-hydroxytetrahydrobiopterin dehydratase
MRLSPQALSMELSRQRLDEDAILARLTGKLSDWRLSASSGSPVIERHLSFPSFKEAFAFMAAGALAAEQLNHHPEWTNVYNRIDICLSTHDAGGVTEYDLVLAERFEELASLLAS